MRNVAVVLSLWGFLSGSLLYADTASSPAPPNALRVSKYILTVSNLEKTYAFYHSLGIELEGATELRQPQKGATANRTTGSPADSSFRNANNKSPVRISLSNLLN